MDAGTLPVRLVIVGHVDHGKSTFIGRLLCDTGSVPDAVLERVRRPGADLAHELAFITDHLAEERRDEKTIDTTQVFFRHGGRHYVIIDTPGHAEFLRNMFTGASRADAALIVVDAAESVQRQTLAHGHVLGLLGIRFVIPMVNKMDKVGYSRERFEAVASAVAARLREAGVELRAAVPVSALVGDNVAGRSDRMPWYRGPTLLEAFAGIPGPRRASDRPMRFAVQGLYDLADRRLYLGRVEAGTLRAGQAVRQLPAGVENTVLTVEVYGGRRESAEAGESVGVTLAQAVAPARGLVLCDAQDAALAGRELTGRLVWLSDDPLVRGESLELRIATQEVPARVERIAESFHSAAPDAVQPEADRLAYGEIGLVTLSLDGAIAYEPFSRENSLGTFVLARGGDVAGAGTIPDGLSCGPTMTKPP